jgi:cupin superfamily acireductone dioxygenase involved in methionine salvage
MTKDQIKSVVAGGVPFTLRMTDGKEYYVPHRDYISIPPTGSYVIVFDDQGRFTVLPLLTMTGVESKVSEDGKEEQ